MDVETSSLDVTFVGSRKMESLNYKYRGKRYSTDVLSFRYPGESEEGVRFLGEIVIAPEVARLQSHRWNVAPEKELRKLLVHGILHLLGYDHETDKGEMKGLENRLMRSKAIARCDPVASPEGQT